MMVLLESLRYERAHARAYQGPCTSTFLEFAELSGKGETAFGYSPFATKSGGGHEGRGTLRKLTRKLIGELFQILKTVYLPEETSTWLLESSKTQKPVGASKVSFQGCGELSAPDHLLR
jgi:hypothetical protein